MNLQEKLLQKLRYRVWARLKVNSYPSYNLSHSQFGEDMIVRSLLSHVKQGCYVDIGAHHPVSYSNTYYFYCKGWRGLNVDATPGSMDLFRVLRPEDTNVETCLGPVSGQKVNFFVFDRGAVNTMDACLAEEIIATKQAKLLKRHELSTLTLAECLDKYVQNKPIHLLSIDVEGMDEAILQSNDWNRYAPEVLVFERLHASVAELEQSALMQTLHSYGYRLYGKCGHSVILHLEKSAK